MSPRSAAAAICAALGLAAPAPGDCGPPSPPPVDRLSVESLRSIAAGRAGSQLWKGAPPPTWMEEETDRRRALAGVMAAREAEGRPMEGTEGRPRRGPAGRASGGEET